MVHVIGECPATGIPPDDAFKLSTMDAMDVAGY